MRTWYDTEFIERGPNHRIVLVSIGMVREDGASLYHVNGDLAAHDQAYLRNHPWLGPNVWAHLPTRPVQSLDTYQVLDHADPAVKPRDYIRNRVSEFCAEGLDDGAKADLWAYFADYDHVVLAQLFGTMMDLPPHMPMFTRDLQQEAVRLGVDLSAEVSQSDVEHHALADAQWNRRAHAHLEYVVGLRTERLRTLTATDNEWMTDEQA